VTIGFGIIDHEQGKQDAENNLPTRNEHHKHISESGLFVFKNEHSALSFDGHRFQKFMYLIFSKSCLYTFRFLKFLRIVKLLWNLKGSTSKAIHSLNVCTVLKQEFNYLLQKFIWNVGNLPDGAQLLLHEAQFCGRNHTNEQKFHF
jgi:hypothetical protein